MDVYTLEDFIEYAELVLDLVRTGYNSLDGAVESLTEALTHVSA